MLSYYSYSRGPNRPLGMHIRTDITLSGNDTLQPMSDVLSKDCRQPHPALIVSGYLSNNCHWDSPVVPNGFTFSASIMKMEVNLFDVVGITDVGIDFIARRTAKLYKGLPYEFDYGYWGGQTSRPPDASLRCGLTGTFPR